MLNDIIIIYDKYTNMRYDLKYTIDNVDTSQTLPV